MRRQHCAPAACAALLLASVALGGCATTGAGTAASAGPAGPPSTKNEVADIQTKLGLGYMREGRLDLAFDHLRNAIHFDPGYSTAHMALALCYENLGEQASAEQHFSRAVNVNASDSSARNNYGRFLCRSGRHEQGLAQVEAALGNPLYQSRQSALVNAGLCAQGAAKPELAERYLREALDANPNLGPALLPMAEISFDTSNYLSTRAYLQRFAAIGPLPAKHLLLGVRTEQALGNKEAAFEYASQLRSAYPDAKETAALEREVI